MRQRPFFRPPTVRICRAWIRRNDPDQLVTVIRVTKTSVQFRFSFGAAENDAVDRWMNKHRFTRLFVPASYRLPISIHPYLSTAATPQQSTSRSFPHDAA